MAEAAELQWRRGGPQAKQTARQADAQQSGQFTTPAVRRDGAVRVVAYEMRTSDGPSFAGYDGDSPAGGPEFRSVVSLPTADSHDAVRSAQLPLAQPESDFESRYDLRAPFGQPTPEDTAGQDQPVEADEVPLPEGLLPPDEYLPSDELPPTMTDDELALPEADAPAPAGRERRPRTFELQPRTLQPGPAPRDRTGVDPFDRSRPSRQEGVPPAAPGALDREKKLADEDCNTALEQIKSSTLADVDLSIAVSGTQGQDYPFECSIDDGTWHTGRCWSETTYMWKASAVCHKPLYFEHEALERYGHSWGPYADPIVSGAHFFSRLAVLPYSMGVYPPHECMYALGHYRPGSCAPYMIDPVPISLRGGLMQAGAVVGAAAVLP